MIPEGIQFNEIDQQFASFICRQAGSEDKRLWCAAALLSRGVVAGDVCLDLAAALADGSAAGYGVADLETWVTSLRAHAVVGEPGEFAPLVLDPANRLYLHRYWRYEDQLAAAILARGAAVEFDREVLAASLARLFPTSAAGATDWQRVAALAALTRRFCVISGGPGTGKTSTVVKVLALLLEQMGGRDCRIALVAPTGKAAARLKESIVKGIDCAAELRALIPEDVSTIHRLLGYLKGSASFRHHRDNPLPFDVIIVDEASMVSLPLMAKLVDALRQDTRLILLGDRDQLASVEAGSVLGDICNTGAVNGFSKAFVQLAAELSRDQLDEEPDLTGAITPAKGMQSYGEVAGRSELGDAVVLLRKSYRFSENSGIGKVSALVNVGNGPAALEAMRDAGCSDLLLADAPAPGELGEALASRILEGYGDYLAETSPEAAFARFGEFRILCAMRSGPFGVEAVNRIVEERLARAGLVKPGGRWYPGEPVMITRNDYNLGLFNGDIGLLLPDPENGGELRAYFPSGSGMRKVLPLRLPEHECAFAMTVHKSQGSEFDRVLLLMPDRDAPLLTRELVYTAITRAKKSVEILASDDLFCTAVERQIVRRSGLREKLWGREPIDG
ncbi:RecBCD enzyme subunit RecD [Geomonas limicola]|uniref:RecBCD enzyme subunit RecD n=1 Tax=Geomonas limicola TaxID=2740186 RepID=A0A6V8NES4_9BACT|nr:exodeoxyribonuclease V subunit alpha [Geomonas limicola]GFO70073.1 RecBCD enzyme subunit RecD [Geomonas limicola]